jgi:hypothetical protein
MTNEEIQKAMEFILSIRSSLRLISSGFKRSGLATVPGWLA